MKKLVFCAVAAALVSACTPARVVGGAAVTTGQVALGAVDLVL